MNQRLEGWRLALAVLIPAVIVALAIWFAIQALSGDDNTSVDTADPDLVAPTPTEVAPPETDEVATPTVVPTPTAFALPTSPPAPTAAPTTDVAATPEPTSAPAPTS